MSDDHGAFEVSAVRDRAARREDGVDESVMAAIEARADDGRLAPDAVADWHAECREAHRSTTEDVDAAEERLREIRESIDPVDRDTNQVRARIEEFADQFDSMRSALSTTADRLDDTPTAPESPAAVYGAAEQLRRCGRVVHEVAHSLHHLESDIEAFETWLDDPETRIEELDDEIDGFERYLDNTEALLDRLESNDTADIRPFGSWLAAYHLQRMMSLVFDELRADIADLDAWLERRDGSYGDAVADLRDRLDALEARHAACSERLDAATAEVEDFERKRAEVAESLDRFEATLDDHEPPVDWGAVEELIQGQFDDLGIRVQR